MTNLQKIRKLIKYLDGIQTEETYLNNRGESDAYISEEWQIDGVTIYLTAEPDQEK